MDSAFIMPEWAARMKESRQRQTISAKCQHCVTHPASRRDPNSEAGMSELLTIEDAKVLITLVSGR
jgi:hypothetical protein